MFAKQETVGNSPQQRHSLRTRNYRAKRSCSQSSEIVEAYKTSIGGSINGSSMQKAIRPRRPETAQPAKRNKRIQLRYKLESRQSRTKNYRDWITDNNLGNNMERCTTNSLQQKSSKFCRPQTPAQYEKSSRGVIKSKMSHLRPHTAQGSCYRNFRLTGEQRSSKRKVSPKVSRVIWSMPSIIQKLDGNKSGSLRQDLSGANRGGRSGRSGDSGRGGDSGSGSIPGVAWIVLKRPLPLRFDSTLCSERDVRDLILSCSRNAQILALNVSQNLKIRFAHILVKKNAEKLVLKHQTSLGRAFGRWDNVTAQVLPSAPTFAFFCMHGKGVKGVST